MPASSPARFAPGPVGEERRLQNARVLLAEDNLVNQEVGRLMLEAMGCVVDVVGDGEAAVGKAREGAYDAVLLDCRMPRLDGRQAASEIRALGGRWSRVPIIAVTADVLDGERERCLQAGMDCVLTKPLRWDDLRAALETRVGGLVAGSAGQSAVAHAPGSMQGDEEIDWKVLASLSRLRRPDGPDPVAHLVALFLEDAPARLSAIARVIASGDSQALREAAHALKGTAATVGAVRLRSLCAAMEEAPRDGSMAAARDLFGQAQEAFTRVELALRQRPTGVEREAACGPTAA